MTSSATRSSARRARPVISSRICVRVARWVRLTMSAAAMPGIVVSSSVMICGATSAAPNAIPDRSAATTGTRCRGQRGCRKRGERGGSDSVRFPPARRDCRPQHVPRGGRVGCWASAAVARSIHRSGGASCRASRARFSSCSPPWTSPCSSSARPSAQVASGADISSHRRRRPSIWSGRAVRRRDMRHRSAAGNLPAKAGADRDPISWPSA